MAIGLFYGGKDVNNSFFDVRDSMFGKSNPKHFSVRIPLFDVWQTESQTSKPESQTSKYEQQILNHS